MGCVWSALGCLGVALIVIPKMFVVPVMTLASPLLGLMGFSSIGPVLGSLVAAIQSCIGNIAAGSLFAILQSAAMGGAGALSLVQAVGGCLVGMAAALAAQLSRDKGKD